MATSMPPIVECDETFAGLAVSDVTAAVDFYTTQLGFKLGFTWGGPPPTFAGVKLGKVEVFLQKGTPDPKGCCVYFHVDDADTLYEFHRAKGVEVAQEIADREYGMRDYVVRDLNGYYLSLAIICSMPGRRSRTSVWTYQCASKDGLLLYSRIWQSTNA